MVERGIEQKATEWMALVRPYMRERRNERVKFSPEDSALLVIDMQKYFLDKSSHAYVPASVEILENVRTLIAAYRKKSLPVIFTREGILKDEDPGAMGRWWGDMLRIDDKMSEIPESFAPRADETVIRKSHYSAFIGTDLEKRLRDRRISRVVVTGVLTHLCCESTARDAFMHDFDVFFVIDGTATDTEDLHVSSLRTLTDGFAMPVTTAEVVKRFRRTSS